MRPVSLTQSAAPAAEPLSLIDVQDHLLLTDANVADSDVRKLAALIALARTYVEDMTGLQLITATWVQKLDAFPGADYIMLRKPPLATITSITYLDAAGNAQTLSSSTAYQADTSTIPGRVLLRYGQTWPTTYDYHNAVTITYTAGYGAAGTAVPEPLRQAMLLMIEHWYRFRGPTTEDVLNDVPYAVDALTASYRDWHHAV